MDAEVGRRQGDKMDDKNNITKYRKKKQRKSFWVRFLIFMLVVVAAVLIVINREAIFSPLEDAGLKVGEGGFPVSLPGSTEYFLGELGDGFYLLTDTYLYTYNDEGAEIAGIQHGFQNPASDSKGKRALVYDRNGTAFKMYSRTEEVFRNTVSDSIVFAAIGNKERSAVVTTSTRYSNYLYVYSSEGKQIFRWASPDEKIMGVCFDKDDASVYVSVIGESGGELKASLVKFSLQGSDTETWRTAIGSDITYSLEYCSDGIYAVTGTGMVLLDENSGEIKASNTFVHRVHGIPNTDGLRAVIFHDSASNGETAVIYNSELESVASASIDELLAFDISGGRLYILGRSMLSVYNSSLECVKSYDLDDEYADVRIIDNSAYLLGYNSVQRVPL